MATIKADEITKIIREQIENYQQSIAVEQERAAKIEKTQKSPFEVILAKLKGATSLQRLKLWCEGPTDVPVFKALLAQIPDTPEILFDFVGGWPALVAKDPETFQHGCKEAIVVMDGDDGRHLGVPGKPLTRMARAQGKRFAGLPVGLHVLQRYGIENYFPRSVLETILGQSLARFFPIPDHVSACEYLRDDEQGWWQGVKRFLVSRCHINLKLRGRALYPKSFNERVAPLLVLDRDLSGTDLSTIIHLVAEKAKALADT